MKPQNLKTKIFYDGGDPEETRELIDLLGFLDDVNALKKGKNSVKKRFYIFIKMW
jgi:hypothetical protein